MSPIVPKKSKTLRKEWSSQRSKKWRQEGRRREQEQPDVRAQVGGSNNATIAEKESNGSYRQQYHSKDAHDNVTPCTSTDLEDDQDDERMMVMAVLLRWWQNWKRKKKNEFDDWRAPASPPKLLFPRGFKGEEGTPPY